MNVSKFLKISIFVCLVCFVLGPLWAAPDTTAHVKLFQGFKEASERPARVVSSFYLKPLEGKKIFPEVNNAKEKESLKKIFNLKEIKLLTWANMVIAKDRPAFQVIVLDGRELKLFLSEVSGQKNRFKVEVLEKGKNSKSLLETGLMVPPRKTTVLGFADSAGKNYFLSFHRGKDVKSSRPPSAKGKKFKKFEKPFVFEKPGLIRKVKPVYPPEALKAGVKGSVKMEVFTDIYGRVREGVVISGHPMLREAAAAAVKQWVYEPFIMDGVPRGVKLRVNVSFTLDSKKKIDPVSIPSAHKSKLIKEITPRFPPKAKSLRLPRIVVLEVTVGIYGRVLDVKAIAGHPSLKEAAAAAVKQWVYEPYVNEGIPKPVIFTEIIEFKTH